MASKEHDFSVGSIPRNIISLALPMTAAQLINVLYSVVDRIYLGRLPGHLALTGLGLTLPIISIVMGFANLCGTGGAPLCSIYRGKGEEEEAERIMGNAFTLLLIFGVAVTGVFLLFRHPLLYLFGASDATYPYAEAYMTIYLLGTVFVMIGLGMNPFITSQGFGRTGMMTVGLGAVVNIVLDPVFIFGLGMGTGGAGTATALSQSISFCILLSMFLRGKTVSRFRITQVTRSARDFGQIFFNGAPSFGRQGLNSIGSMLLNVAARNYGDAAVAGMSIVSRIFQFVLSVAIGVGQGLQPVAAFNYGARRFARVRKAAIFTISTAFVFMAVLNSLCWFNAEPLIRLFRDDPAVTAVALPALRYQCIAMFLQPVIIVTNMMFQSIGKSGRATFLACCRQGVCFIPLILTLPRIWGLSGIELCQPIADGLTFCISVPFLLPFLKELKEQGDEE